MLQWNYFFVTKPEAFHVFLNSPFQQFLTPVSTKRDIINIKKYLTPLCLGIQVCIKPLLLQSYLN